MKWIVIALAAALPLAAQDETFGLKVRGWFSVIDGSVKASESSVNGTNLDLKADLQVGRVTHLSPEIHAWFKPPFIGRFNGGFFTSNFTGHGSLTRDISFAGVSYTAGSDFTAKAHTDTYYLDYEFSSDVVKQSEVRLQLGVQVGLEGFTGEFTVESSGSSAKRNEGAVLPILGGVARAYFSQMVVGELEVKGMMFNISNWDVTFWDAALDVRAMYKNFSIGAGYHWVTVNGTRNETNNFTDFDFDISGFFISGGVTF